MQDVQRTSPESVAAIPLTVLSDTAHVPQYARPGDAGADLVAGESATIPSGGGRALIGTGVAVAIPEGHAGLVLPRSGNAAKHGVTVTNSPGLIDSGYRGEIKVALLNTDPTTPFDVVVGDRIAQLVIVPVAAPAFVEVDELPVDAREGARGAGGFGHTGVAGHAPSAPFH